MLYLESGRHARRTAGVGIGGTAAGDDTTEIVGAAGIGRTLPPRGNSACSVVLILYLAVSSRVIGILFKIVWLLC